MDDARQKLIDKLASLPQQGGPPNPDASVSVHPVVVEGRLVGGRLHQAYDCSASRGSVKALPGDGLGIELIKPEGAGNGIATQPQNLNITFPNGSTVALLPEDAPTPLQGINMPVVVLDDDVLKLPPLKPFMLFGPIQPQLDESKCIVCGEESTHGIVCRNKEIGGWDHWDVCTAHKDLNKGSEDAVDSE